MTSAFTRTASTIAGLGVAAAVAAGGAGVANAQTSSTGSGDGLHYVKIKEPFGKPGTCDMDGTTLQIANCYLKRVVKTDKKIDVLQKQRFEYAPTKAKRKAYLKNDAAWLKRRTATVAKIDSGGTIDTITQAQLTWKLSKKRLNALR